MINKQTIISAYDEKLTLVQWLKSVNKALDEAVLTNVEIAQRGNATFVFVFTFEDGTRVESNEIIVNQGESIVGATIQNGHLLLTLSNDDVLDAGNVKPVSSFSFNNTRHLIVYYADGTNQDLGLIKGLSYFSIDANQHLIVHYDNNTSEDLGAIFNGNVNIDGTLNVTGLINGIINGHNINTDGIVIAEYIRPRQPNASWDLNFTTSVTGVTLTEIFSKLKVIAGVMHVVVQFKITNNTDSPISLYQFATSASIEVHQEWISENVYDLKGATIKDAISSETTIAKVSAISFADTTPQSETISMGAVCALVNMTTAKFCKVIVRANGYSLPAGATRYISTRMALTLV